MEDEKRKKREKRHKMEDERQMTKDKRITVYFNSNLPDGIEICDIPIGSKICDICEKRRITIPIPFIFKSTKAKG